MKNALSKNYFHLSITLKEIVGNVFKIGLQIRKGKESQL